VLTTWCAAKLFDSPCSSMSRAYPCSLCSGTVHLLFLHSVSTHAGPSCCWCKHRGAAPDA
jgi:hypothetical protein